VSSSAVSSAAALSLADAPVPDRFVASEHASCSIVTLEAGSVGAADRSGRPSDPYASRDALSNL
jgi:hypothetical protein